MPKPVRRVLNPDLIAWAHLIRILNDPRSPGYTNRKLAKKTGLNYLTVCRYTAVLHQIGAAYIARYEMDARGAQTIRVFRLGQDDDAIIPKRSRAVRARAQRHRERMRGAA